MKKLVLLFIVLIGLSGISKVMSQKKELKTVCFTSNMDCADCENTILEYVKFEKGVKNLKVDHVSNTVMIVYAANKNNDEALAKAIQKKGYKAEKITPDQYEKIVEAAKNKEHDHSGEFEQDK